MNTCRLSSLILALIFGTSTFACEDAPLPWHFLGESLSNLEPQFISITYDGVFEDERFNEKRDERWLAIDQERHYVTLHTVDQRVTELYISDSTYATQNGIRVGDSFNKILGAYGTTLDFDAHALISGATSVVSTIDGRITFWLSSRELRAALRDGKQVGFEHPLVQNMTLWLIHIKTRRAAWH